MNGAQIVTSVDDVPAGYIRLADAVPADYAGRSTVLQYLSTQQRKGRLPAYKLIRRASEKGIGAVFIEKRSAAAMIAAWEEARKGTKSGRAMPNFSPIISEIVTAEMQQLSVINPQAPAENNQLSLQDVAKLLYAIQQNISELRREVADVRAAAELQVEAVYMRVSTNQPALEVVDG